MYTDSHCHLDFPELQADLPAVLAAMRAAGVTRALCIGTTLERFDAVHRLALQGADGSPRLWATVGVHPDHEHDEAPTVERLLELAARPRVVGIGETGLDYYRLEGRTVADMEWQRERFRVHIRAARRADLPLVIHTRAAADHTLAILREEGGLGSTGGDGLPPARGVFHCFTESLEVARAALDLGFLISFSGIVTFKNAASLREVARLVPLDRTLIETDSPYLAPVPHRGKVNTPAYVPLVAAQLAELHGVTAEEVGRITSDNFTRLFDRVQQESTAGQA
ncbi:putative metal-dependent hydrolase YcfH [Tepidimonas sediminis]|uniref:Putative metal-dependent hydrolase YcfH n=1 Tax=Tepidimonas sediminis TaxID=2588941 RepID=A0A554WV62_9BURK|nr:TatD family hydrolase [Tepidimonas sediminis]TSE27461.1 putative metal-dependent hydrolase YcfH [Tepidimonas sediminis]